ncbi:MAG TPA: IS4 family transposase [Streptosporangiaceae bacterium]
MGVHAVTGGRWSSTVGRVLAGVGVGVPARWVTPELADEVLAQAGEGAGGQRFRALPGRLGMYFVLGLCLHAGTPYREVLRKLTWGLGGALAAAGWQVPASTALTGLRRRLGEKPFELLFWRLAGPLSPGTAPGSHIGGLLAAAWDGTTVKAPASEPNITTFGRPRGKKDGHYPQIRLVTLIACGTRALAGAAMGPVRGRGTGEQALARDLLGSLHAGMLLLADRNFYGFSLWRAAAGTGADLLWRVKASLHLPVVRPLPDGSWLSVIPDPAAVRRRTVRNGARRRRGSKLGPDTGPLPGITVRVIQFWLTVATGDGAVRTERYRLITTLLDHRAYPAAGLAAGYARRWAIETGFREFKTYLRGPGRILRGRTPELARQELWAYLALYQAIRAIMCLAAAGARLDPDRISFTATLHAVRRTAASARTSPDAALAETEADILTELVPDRAGRVCVRAVTQPASPFPSRANRKGPLSQHAQCTITIRAPHQAPQTAADQPKQPGNRETRPP